MLSPRTKSILNTGAKILFAAVLIAWLVQSGRFDWRSSAALFQGPLFFAGFFLVALNLFLVSERWRWLARPQNVHAGPWEVFRLTLIGQFFNYAMPGGVGGDVVKAYYFGKDHPQARTEAITSVILDRVLGLYAMILMAVAVMLWDHERVLAETTLRHLLTLMIALLAATSAGFLLVFSRRLKRTGWLQSVLSRLPLSQKFHKLYETTHRFGLHRGRVVLMLALSILAQSASILFLWVAGQAAGFTDVPLQIYFLAAPLGYMATAIPISPAGVGVGQAAFYVLFNLYLHHDSGVGATVITSQQVMTALFGAAGAFFYVRRGERAPAAAAIQEQG